MPIGTYPAEATSNSEKIKLVTLKKLFKTIYVCVNLKAWFYLTNTALLSSGKSEAGFWMMFFHQVTTIQFYHNV